MQDEGRSYLGVDIFGSKIKDGVVDEDSRSKEERKEKVVGHIIDAPGDKEEVEGGTRF